MLLIQHNITKLDEIKNMLMHLPTNLYIEPKEILSQSTIGQHFRHIIEFYVCLENGVNQKLVCYDDRERDIFIETNTNYAIDIINRLKLFLSKIKHDIPIEMKANYSINTDEKTLIQTTLFRELAYALDHTIHHLAIIKIALSEDNLEIDSNFGVAPSTLRHRRICAQ